MKLLLLLAACTVPSTVAAFVKFHTSTSNGRGQIRPTNDIEITPSRPRRTGNGAFGKFRHSFCPLRADKSEDGGNPDIDAMRKLLEASWNVETMGTVPSSPENAAEAAAQSVQIASGKGKKTMLIDLLLPAYDITQGENLYDEIMAVDFCISLAKYLRDANVSLFSAILVKDGKAERVATRVVEARRRADDDAVNTDANSINEGTDVRNEVQKNLEGIENSGILFDDDLDGIGISNAGFVDDLELFRQQLTSTWNDVSEEDVVASTRPGNEAPPSSTLSMSNDQMPPEPKGYRIGSLLGDQPISSGPDMFDDVINAVDTQAVQSSDNAIIILSAFTREEMIAVRRVVARYDEKKTIILVNCKLNPLPRELIGAEIVYSLLPLVAKRVQTTDNIFETHANEEKPSPKVVVLRRYPRDWEVFVDLDGAGFDLVASISADKVESKGPSMDWIAGCLKRYMASKTGI